MVKPWIISQNLKKVTDNKAFPDEKLTMPDTTLSIPKNEARGAMFNGAVCGVVEPARFSGVALGAQSVI